MLEFGTINEGTISNARHARWDGKVGKAATTFESGGGNFG